MREKGGKEKRGKRRRARIGEMKKKAKKIWKERKRFLTLPPESGGERFKEIKKETKSSLKRYIG